MLASAESEMVRLISREIIFQEFEPIWSQYLNVTDGPTDGRTDGRTTCQGNTALRVASRGKKSVEVGNGSVIELDYMHSSVTDRDKQIWKKESATG